MRLAFALDGYAGHAGALLRQAEPNGPIAVDAEADGDRAIVERQIRRILSLDHPGRDWIAVATRDPVIGRLQKEHPGLRPVLFHSPYEGAAWSIISARKPRAYAASVRTKLAAAHGKVFALAGEELAAFPLPESILRLHTFAGLDPTKLTRLHAVARAALDGALDADHLAGLDPDRARAELETLPGIGPFYADLVLVRATGSADLLPRDEPKLLSYLGQLYGLNAPADAASLERIAERWKPFRTWAAVLVRVAGDRAGLPVEAHAPARGPRMKR